MANKSEYLFHLIKSLSKSEKRYFKLYVSTHKETENSSYIRLFDAFEKTEQYADTLDIHSIGEKPASSKQLSKQKERLYEMLLKSLAAFQESASIENKIAGIYEHCKVLYRKSLYEQCEKLLEKGIVLAEKYEAFPLLIRLLLVKSDLYNAQAFHQKTEEDVEALFKKIITVHQKSLNSAEYLRILSLSFKYSTQKGYLQSADEREKHRNLLREKIVMKDHTLSRVAIRYLYSAKMNSSIALNDMENALQSAASAVKVMEEHPHFIKETPRYYVSALFNFSICLIKTRRFPQVTLTLQKLREFQQTLDVRFINENNRITGMLHSVGQELNVLTGNFQQGKIFAEQYIDRKVNIQNPKQKKVFYYETARAYFGLEEYASAVKYLRKVQEEVAPDVRSDLNGYAKLLTVIIYYEQEKHELLEYSIKNVYKFLYKRDSLRQFERRILKFMKSYSGVMKHKKLMEAFSILKSELALLFSENASEKQTADGFFDIISWLESKIEDRSFTDVIQKKLKAQRKNLSQ